MDKAESKPAAKSGAGLEGVVAAESAIGDVDGLNGVLLWHGRLPKRDELDALKQELSASMRLPAEVVELMRRFPAGAEPMDALRTAVSALAFYDPGARDLSRDGALRTATKLTAQLPVVVAALERLRNGKEPIESRADLNP